MKTKYIIAAFNTEEESSVLYRKYLKTDSVANQIKELLDKGQVDYISLRVLNRKKIVKLENFFIKEE